MDSDPSSGSAAHVAELPDWTVTPDIDPAEAQAQCPRILSAAPNVTELCSALGLTNCLVGRTRFCTHPPAAASVPSIGDLYHLQVERLVALHPELVIVSGNSRAMRDRLDQLNIPLLTLRDETVADLFSAITTLGDRVGRPRTAARLAQHLSDELDAIAARHAGGPARRVLITTAPLGENPSQIDVAGPGSFYDDLLRRLGHANVAAATQRPFAPLSVEYVVAADPDVIIELAPDASARPAGDADACRAWERLGRLRAVECGRVHVFVGPEHFLLGPRLPRTFAALADRIAEGAP